MKKMCWLKDKENSRQKAAETSAFVQELIFLDINLSDEDKREKVAFFEELIEEKRNNTHSQEIPDTLCCKITFVNFIIKDFTYKNRK